MPNDKPTQPAAYQIDDLIKQSKVVTVATAPPQPEKSNVPEKGGMFKGNDGRNYWRYDLHGEQVVLPKPIEQMQEQDFYDLPVSLYDSMAGRLPQNLTVKFKDPQWAGYWFNKKAGSGARVSVARSLGYVPATKDDIEVVGAGLNDYDGAIEQHDLVLMKIHKARLFLKYKEWIDKAKVRGGIESYKNAADSYVQQGGGDLDKGQYYLTPQAKQEFQGLGPVVNLPTVAST
jgi:hypothetical protein